MSQKTVLITGGYGCIGSQTAKFLVRNSDCRVIVASRSVSPERTARVFYDVDQSTLSCVALDVCDSDGLEKLIRENQVTHVAHMAAFQSPDCNQYRDLGLQINLAATQRLIEVMKKVSTIERFVYASSIAVYGSRATYPEGTVSSDARPQPVNVYGVWKYAAEQVSKFFHDDTGVPTMCVRPGVLFGPGRDAGLTSTPTTAMKCVALNLPYEVPFQTRQDFQFSLDVGTAVGHMLTSTHRGFQTYTLPSHTVATKFLVESLHKAAQRQGLEVQFQITIGDGEVPFICDLESNAFEAAFPQLSFTSLDDAIDQSLARFVDYVNRGWLTNQDIR